MKTITKLVLVISAIFIANISYGQQTARVTLWPGSVDQGCAIVTLQKPGGGYITGTSGDFAPPNGLYNIEVAQFYDLSLIWLKDSIDNLKTANPNFNPRMDTVQVRITRKTLAATPGNLVVKLYSSKDAQDILGNSRPEPNVLLGTSNPINMSDVNIATGVFTKFSFTTPVNVPSDGKFFASVVLSQVTGDSICIGATSCTEYNGFSYQLLNVAGTSAWIQFNKNIQTTSGFLETDVLIVPDLFGDVASYISHDDAIQLREAFPNPATDNIRFNFLLNRSGNVSISIYNLNGQLVKAENFGQLSKGNYEKTFNVAEMPSGFYMYEISSGNGKTYGKFTVN